MTWNEGLHAFCHGLRSRRVRKLQVFHPKLLARFDSHVHSRACTQHIKCIDLESPCEHREMQDHWFPQANKSLGFRLREDEVSEERPDFLDWTHFIRRQTSPSRGDGRRRGWGWGGPRGGMLLEAQNGLSCETLMRRIMASDWKEGQFGVDRKAPGRIRGNVG